MFKKISILTLSLLMIPFLPGCDEQDVATGIVVGAAVGGTIAAVATDDYYHNPYHYRRYNRYYKYRHKRYRQRYGQHRYGHRYGHYKRWYSYSSSGKTALPDSIQKLAGTSSKIVKFAEFYQMPMDSAQKLWSAKQKALSGNLKGLSDIGLFKKDFQRLMDMKAPRRDTLYRISLRTGLDEDHVNDILTDIREEIKASEQANRF